MTVAPAIAAHGHLSIAGMRLEYRAHSAASKTGDRLPTFILLHEGLGCVEMWRDFPQLLSKASGANVFAYSRAGYGASTACALPRPLDYMQHEGEQVLPQVLDAIGVRRCVLFGHSDGASIAAICAGAHPDPRLRDPRIRGLVLMAPHFFTEDAGLHAIAQARIAFEQEQLRERLGKYHGDNVDCAFRGWNDAWLHADFRAWNISHYLPRINVPVLAIQGERDQYGSDAQIHALRERCAGPLEVLMLAECAHAPFREQAQRTLDSVCAWFSKLDASAYASDRDQVANLAGRHTVSLIKAASDPGETENSH